MARRVTRFLMCYEGPYANTENLTDPSRRPACMAQAGLDFGAVNVCANNSTGSLLRRMQHLINATRAPMYALLQPNPGYFPHIFIDGAHQWNNSWTALLNTLCNDTRHSKSTACKRLRPTLTFEVSLHKALVESARTQFSASVKLGVNFAASQIALPHHFRTKGEPDDAPSYVNIQAVTSASIISLLPTNASSWLRVKMELGDVVAGNMDALRGGVASDTVTKYMAWALSRQENAGVFGQLTSKSIRKLHLM